MFNPPGFKENCPHCKSSKMEYYGYTLGAFHFYHRCSNCRKYTEYLIPSKKFMIMSLIILLAIVFAIVPSLFIFSISPLSAFLFFLGYIILSLIIGDKYGRHFWEAAAIDNLPDNYWIVDPHDKIRFTGFAIIIAVLLAYVMIIIVNLVRQ
jgi:hypothetical protein